MSAADRSALDRRLLRRAALLSLLLHAGVLVARWPEGLPSVRARLRGDDEPRRALVVREWVPPLVDVAVPAAPTTPAAPAAPAASAAAAAAPAGVAPEPWFDLHPEPIVIEVGEPDLDPEAPRIGGTGGVTIPELIVETATLPAYPPPAAASGISGWVVLRLLVRADGSVGEITVLQVPQEGLGFGEAAVAAVQAWRFHPAREGGRPVDAIYTQALQFTPP